MLTTRRNPAPARIASCCVPRCRWGSRCCVRLHGACQRSLLARDVLLTGYYRRLNQIPFRSSESVVSSAATILRSVRSPGSRVPRSKSEM